MDADDWTPARGWGIALRKAGLRAGIVFVGLTIGLYFFWPVTSAIMGLGLLSGLWIILFVLFSSAMGAALAHAIVRGLKADSALEGWRLLVPMLLIVTAAEAGACYMAASFLRGVSPAMLIGTFCAMFLWSWVSCVVKLLIL